MLKIITGGAGCGKTFEMMNRIESAVLDGQDVLVIIPDQFTFEVERNLYERLKAENFNRIEVLSFTRAAREIFIRCGGKKGKYADDIVKNAVMFQCISQLAERKELKFYDKQAGQIPFVESCLEVVKELTVSGVDAAALAQGAERSDESIRDKISDISLIYTAYCSMLEEKGYKDGEGDISKAAQAAVNGFFKGKTIFVDAFKSFTADEYDMLKVMLADGKSLTVCLTTEDWTGEKPGRTGYSVFETVNNTVGKLIGFVPANSSGEKQYEIINVDAPGKETRFRNKELEFFSRNVLRNNKNVYDGKCGAVQVYRSDDTYGEGDFVCSEIRRLVMPDETGKKGYSYSDIAVVARQKEAYSSVMESSFERYGIPFYTDESHTAGHKALFILVKTALRLAADENASSEEWLRYAKNSLLGIWDNYVSAVEDHCYKWGVEGKEWNDTFLRKEGEEDINEFSESAAEKEFAKEDPEPEEDENSAENTEDGSAGEPEEDEDYILYEGSDDDSLLDTSDMAMDPDDPDEDAEPEEDPKSEISLAAMESTEAVIAVKEPEGSGAEEENPEAEEENSQTAETKESKAEKQDRKEREFAEKARKKIAEPIIAMRKACKDADGETICREIFNLIETAGVAKNIYFIYKKNDTDDAAALAANRELKQLWELLCTLLETLSRTLAGTQVTLKEFADIFASAVERLKLSSPPQTLDCVRFAAAHTARLSNVKVLFVIGVNDGIFPYAAKSSGLLNDRDRAALEDIDIVLSGNSLDKLAEERFTAYSAVSSASDRLYISCPDSDVAGKALYPSVIVNQAVNMFGEDVVSSFEKRGIISFCTTPEAAYYQFVQNYHRGDSEHASLKKALEIYKDDSGSKTRDFKSRIKYLEDVENSKNHRLSEGKGEKLFGNTIRLSASRFEDYNKCPFMYFCKKGLNLYPVRRVQMDSPSRGTAVHECMCKFMSAFDKEAFTKMSRKEIYANVKTNLDSYYRSCNVGGNYGKTGRYKAAFSRLASTVTDILVRTAEEFRQSEFVPKGFEYTLKKDGGNEEPLTLDTASGIKVYFDGSIDRIDVFEKDKKKYVRVVDYKTGEKIFRYADLIYGINMQMLLYLFAITDKDHKGLYKNDIPAGVLYMPSKDVKPVLKRDETDKDKAKDATYKMNGVVLAEPEIITAMEKDIGGRFIPVAMKADKKSYTSSSMCITEKELERLRKYSYTLLTETAESLHQGRIEAFPLKDGDSGKLPCEFCDYWSVCGAYPPVKVREYADGKKLEKLEEKLLGRGQDKQAADKKNGADNK